LINSVSHVSDVSLSINYPILRVDGGTVKIINFRLKGISSSANHFLIISKNLNFTIADCFFVGLSSKASIINYSENRFNFFFCILIF
jgi:hypothetical protein